MGNSQRGAAAQKRSWIVAYPITYAGIQDLLKFLFEDTRRPGPALRSGGLLASRAEPNGGGLPGREDEVLVGLRAVGLRAWRCLLVNVPGRTNPRALIKRLPPAGRVGLGDQ